MGEPFFEHHSLRIPSLKITTPVRKFAYSSYQFVLILGLSMQSPILPPIMDAFVATLWSLPEMRVILACKNIPLGKRLTKCWQNSIAQAVEWKVVPW